MTPALAACAAIGVGVVLGSLIGFGIYAARSGLAHEEIAGLGVLPEDRDAIVTGQFANGGLVARREARSGDLPWAEQPVGAERFIAAAPDARARNARILREAGRRLEQERRDREA